MKAAFIHQPGPPESIQYACLPEPEMSSNQILVEVMAVSVNPIDTYIRSGKVAMDLPSPFIVGCDFAGRVLQVGSQVTQFKPGDRVWGSNQGLLGRQGTFAERIAIDAQWAYKLPDEVSFESAAAVALVGITAHLGLFAEAGLQAGQTLFIPGGSGGVGSMVVQMASLHGAKVITTAGSPGKAERCRELGADEVILYREQSVEDSLKQVAPQGVDVWWETLREPDFDLAIGCLAPRGSMILMAGREARPCFPVGPFYVKQCQLRGFVMFGAPAPQQAACASEIAGWLADGRITACIDRRLPLSEAGEAHRLQAENTVEGRGVLVGKIVLTP